MPHASSDLLERMARSTVPEALTVESGPAWFQPNDSERIAGFATVSVTRATITIRFDPPEGFSVSKAAYGESNGRLSARDGSWSASNINDAGRLPDGNQLFSTMDLAVRGRGDSAVAATQLWIAGGAWSANDRMGSRTVVAHADK